LSDRGNALVRGHALFLSLLWQTGGPVVFVTCPCFCVRRAETIKLMNISLVLTVTSAATATNAGKTIQMALIDQGVGTPAP
jgi:hypothetical protein